MTDNWRWRSPGTGHNIAQFHVLIICKTPELLTDCRRMKRWVSFGGKRSKILFQVEPGNKLGFLKDLTNCTMHNFISNLHLLTCLHHWDNIIVNNYLPRISCNNFCTTSLCRISITWYNFKARSFVAYANVSDHLMKEINKMQ